MNSLVIFCLFLVLPVCYASCQRSWTSHNGTCYYFSSGTNTWDDAMAYCQDHGGTLAEIKSANVNRFLVTLAQGHAATTFWIGGIHDIRGAGWWMWMGSKTNLHAGYINWAPGYPFDMYTRMIIGTRCALMKNSKWQDSKCDVRTHYACQK